MNAACVCRTPLGFPVVPDVYSITETSSGRPSATSCVEPARMRAIEFAAFFLQPLEALDAFVAAQAARIIVVDVRERGYLGPGFEQLVDLFLVLHERVIDFRVVQDVDEFRGRRILVHRHRNAAEGLRSDHRPVEPRAVVADDREMHSALEAFGRKTARERAHLVGNLAPGPRLPDAEVLLARGRMIGPRARMVQQEPRKGVPPLPGHSFVQCASDGRSALLQLRPSRRGRAGAAAKGTGSWRRRGMLRAMPELVQ